MAADIEFTETPDSRKLCNVPGLQWGRNGTCTFIGALEAALAVTDRPMDYRSLMGATGLAFRVRWWQGAPERWCPSSPVGEFRDECDAAGRAVGLPIRAEWDSEPMQRLAGDFKATIDAGIPALVYDDHLNVAVVAGYEGNGNVLLTHDYDHGEEIVRRPTADLKMFAMFLQPGPEPLSTLEAARLGISLGTRNFRRRHDPENDESRGYWHGPLALSRWSEDIGIYENLTDAERETLFFVSWWNYSGLADARQNAGPFLRQVLPLFPAEARSTLDCAASLYEREAAIVSRAMAQKDAFLGPWSGKDFAAWTEDVRRRERSILAEAAAFEKDAVSAMEDALAE